MGNMCDAVVDLVSLPVLFRVGVGVSGYSLIICRLLSRLRHICARNSLLVSQSSSMNIQVRESPSVLIAEFDEVCSSADVNAPWKEFNCFILSKVQLLAMTSSN